MQILYIVPYVPTLIRTRPYNLIHHLAQTHDVTVVTAWSNTQEQAAIRDLQAVCAVRAARLTRWQSLRNVVRHLPTRIPLQAYYCWTKAVADQIDALIAEGKRFDAVHVEHLRGVPYGLHWQSIVESYPHLQNVPVVWDSVDCISYLFRQAAAHGGDGFGRFATRFDLKRTERFEANMVQTFDHTVVTSQLDKDALIELGEAVGVSYADRISVISNGVDLDYFTPDSSIERNPATLVVTGKMSYHANIAMVTTLVDHIMPLVWQHRPDARLQIVGKDPPRQLQAFDTHPQIEVTGIVPDVRDYLQKATIAVAPVQYGAGIQNKVLEAMACATPTVASQKAVAAIAVQSGHDLLVGDTHIHIANHICTLLNNPQHAQQLGQAGRCYVEQHHDWRGCARRLSEVYEMVNCEW